MKAFVVEHYGNDGLRVADVREPEVGDGAAPIPVDDEPRHLTPSTRKKHVECSRRRCASRCRAVCHGR